MLLNGPPAVAVESARRLAEALMIEHCVVTRPGRMVVDPETGYESPEMTVVYEGKCKVNSYESYEETPTAGEHKYTTQRYQIHFPYEATVLEVGDVIAVDGYRYPFNVTNDFQKSYATARRYFASKVVA